MPTKLQDIGVISNMDQLPILGFSYGTEMNQYQKANLTLQPLKCVGTKDFDKNDVSCTTLKRAGHFKSGIYTLRSPTDVQARLSFCNMETENEDLETLVGYVQVTKTQQLFKAFKRFSSTASITTLILDEVETNYQDVYDKSNGKFVAPFAGNFSFRLIKEGYSFDPETVDDLANRTLTVMSGDESVINFDELKVQYSRYYSSYNSRNNYYYDLNDLDETWEMALEKSEEVSLKMLQTVTLGRHDKKDKLTWIGSLVAKTEN